MPDPSAGEKLFDVSFDYAQARCALPGCAQPLHIVYTVDVPVYQGSTAASLAPEAGWAQSWEVQCEDGHTVCVPIDSAEDSYLFGGCTQHEPGEEHDGDCQAADLARLRAVTQPPD